VTCENPARLHRAGVRFAFRIPAAHNLRAAPLEAGVAVAYGLPREAALAAACGNGPGFWGLKVGQLKVGYEATFARCAGDPLQPRTATTGLWFRGEELPTTSRQTELYERFRTLR
jgi:imidazolonepropionase-like amidohydrolase